MSDVVRETFSNELISHLTECAAYLYPKLIRRHPGDYSGTATEWNIAWRATRADVGRNRRKTLTITFIDIELPNGKLLFGW